jgi:hypothetical protein
VIATLLTVEAAGAAHAAVAALGVAVRAQQRVSIAASLVDPEQLVDACDIALVVATQAPVLLLIVLLGVGADAVQIGAVEPLADVLSCASPSSSRSPPVSAVGAARAGG